MERFTDNEIVNHFNIFIYIKNDYIYSFFFFLNMFTNNGAMTVNDFIPYISFIGRLSSLTERIQLDVKVKMCEWQRNYATPTN